MDIILFPKGRKPNKKLIAFPIKNNRTPLYLNKWQITCPECNHTATFDPEGMIFKYLEYYCKKCGNLNKVSNPGIS